jgi:hypothetical protein
MLDRVPAAKGIAGHVKRNLHRAGLQPLTAHTAKSEGVRWNARIRSIQTTRTIRIHVVFKRRPVWISPLYQPFAIHRGNVRGPEGSCIYPPLITRVPDD